MAKVTLEFKTICNKVLILLKTKGCMFIHNEFQYLDLKLLVCDFGTTSIIFE